jgi:hypothetical protein
MSYSNSTKKGLNSQKVVAEVYIVVFLSVQAPNAIEMEKKLILHCLRFQIKTIGQRCFGLGRQKLVNIEEKDERTILK